MSLRKLAVLLFAMLLCSAVAIVVVLRSPSERNSRGGGVSPGKTQANTKAAPFAYITERKLVLMRGNQTLARVPRIFDEADSAQNKVVWTNDGDYVALLKNVALLQEDPSAEELINVNAQTGDVRHIPCPRCYDLTPVGKNSILAAANASDNSADLKFLKFNLDSGGPGVPVSLNLPVGGSYVRSFLASTQKDVLTQQGGFGAGGYQEQLELTKVDGQSQTSLGYFNSNDYMLAAVSENANDTSASIAVAFRPDSGTCVAKFPILIFTTKGGAFDTDMSNAEPRGHVPGINEGLQVNDLWWGSDGHFHATIESWTCDNSKRAENDKQTVSSPSALWRLDGRTWVREGAIPATMVRQLARNMQVVLVIPGCIGPTTPPNSVIYCNTGTLYSDQDGKRTVVATGVISISAPSPEHLPRVLSTAIPTLGQLAGDFAQGVGFGKVKPTEIFNGGDPTGLVTHVTWKSWGGTQAVGTGKTDYVGPGQSVATGTQEPATIVAFNLGICDGERMYKAVEWYFPQHGQTFDSHQYENICIGTYVPTS